MPFANDLIDLIWKRSFTEVKTDTELYIGEGTLCLHISAPALSMNIA